MKPITKKPTATPFNRPIMLSLMALMAFVLVLSFFGLMFYPSTLMQFNGHLITFIWSFALFIALIYGIIKNKFNNWFGVIGFVLLWSIFPLLKLINHRFIIWQADELLIKVDSLLWGGQPLPYYFTYEKYAMVSDILAGCYFCFYFLVVGAVVFYGKSFIKKFNKNPTKTLSAIYFFDGLILVYVIGFVGYFLLPASGPAFYAMPDKGASGIIAPIVIDIVKQGVTGMDVFPSLHTAVSLYIVGFLYFDNYKKTAILLSPIVLGIIIATIFLRYHYGIDMICGILLAVWAIYKVVKKLNKV